MQFKIPQFIERESKIFGPFTFKQFLYLGIAGSIIFVLYFSLGQTYFGLWLLIAIVLGVTAVSFMYFNIGGREVPTVLTNFFNFFISPKVYLWKKKEIIPKIIRQTIETREEELSLKIAGKSLLKKLSSRIESK